MWVWVWVWVWVWALVSESVLASKALHTKTVRRRYRPSKEFHDSISLNSLRRRHFGRSDPDDRAQARVQAHAIRRVGFPRWHTRQIRTAAHRDKNPSFAQC